MTDYFASSKFKYSEISHYISTYADDNYSLKSYFSNYLLLCVVADFEQGIHSIISDTVSLNNQYYKSYIIKLKDRTFKKYSKSDIVTFFNYFDNNIKSIFFENLGDGVLDKYEVFLAKRHEVAHVGHSSNISFSDLEDVFPIFENVLEAFSKTLTNIDNN